MDSSTAVVRQRPKALVRGKIVKLCRGWYVRDGDPYAHALVANAKYSPCAAISDVWLSSTTTRHCPSCKNRMRMAEQQCTQEEALACSA